MKRKPCVVVARNLFEDPKALEPIAKEIADFLRDPERQQSVKAIDDFLCKHGYRPKVADSRKKRAALGPVKF